MKWKNFVLVFAMVAATLATASSEAKAASPQNEATFINMNGEEVLVRCTNIPGLALFVRWNMSGGSVEYVESLAPDMCAGTAPEPPDFSDGTDPRIEPVFVQSGLGIIRCTSTKDMLLVVRWNGQTRQLEHEETKSELLCGGDLPALTAVG